MFSARRQIPVPTDDVIVVGGGPAGCIAAIVLSRAGLRVRLLDRATFPREKLCGDTLNPGALRVLERLGLHPAEDGLPIRGMLVTGPGGARAKGCYPARVIGRAIRRSVLDERLVQAAAGAGVTVVEGARVDSVAGNGRPQIMTVTAEIRDSSYPMPARFVIAADGRSSRIAHGLALTRYARIPRRWAVGCYFTDVAGLADYGEMHVRAGHYIGVAPLPGGLTNVCVVTCDRSELRDPASLIETAITGEPELADRFVRARREGRPASLGPLAVDCDVPGGVGLLLAGDAAGFVDPMTGDGLRLAMRGAELAAAACLEALDRGDVDSAPQRLAITRRRDLGPRLRFNRVLRALSGSKRALQGAAAATRVSTWPVRRVVRYLGDVSAG
jgi:menaquinone-9 beta-reductase